ncbi:MAG TPA: aminotransferase class IV [Mucilaginibacter sp.]|jgi:D-alanine transaminase/branched-chain amino acid aminotransferase|nr:aminotransferase class IV [Mucilaginibacter sp.]
MESKPKYVSINNEIVPEAEAKIGVSDLSIHRGFGIFDFFKIIDNRPIFIEDHLNRFYRSAAAMNMDAGLDRPALKQAIYELIAKNDLPESGIKIILTGGYSEDGYSMGKPNLIIMQLPFKMEDAAEVKPMKLVTFQHQRQLPAIKTIDYIQAILLKPFIKQNDADDVLYYHNNHVSECPRANIFIVTDDEIITPKDNILAGITRGKALQLSIDGYSMVERNITLDDLFAAKEAFVTSSSKNACPVIAVDGKDIGDGKPGKITGLISEKLYELMLEQPTFMANQ